MIKKLRLYFDHLLFQEYKISLESLGVYRISLALAYLLFAGIPTFSYLAKVPDFFYSPQTYNIARFYTENTPQLWILALIDFGILFSLLFILFGYKIRWSSILFSVLLLLGFSMKFSLGKLGHGIMLVVVPAVMAFSGWGQKFSLPQNRAVKKFLPSGYFPFLLALILGFAMFTAGLSKVAGGWGSPQYNGTFYHFFYPFHFWEGKQSFLAPMFANLPVWWFKAMDYFTVAFELLFLPAVLNKRIFQIFCVISVFFHIATMLIFNIPYINNLIALLLFIRWDGVIHFLKRNNVLSFLQKMMTWKNFFIITILFIVQHLLFLFIWNENLVDDKLISPLSFLALMVEPDFRFIRAMVLLPLSFLILVGQAILKPTSE